MSNQLGDGSIIPSTLSTAPRADARQMQKGNMSVKLGTIIRMLYPDDTGNLSKKQIEYDVVVISSSETNGANIMTYRNCSANNMFGAPNNSLAYTLYPDSDGQLPLKDGAIVLILCIDGSADAGQAVIIGGIAHPDAKQYKREDGQFYDFNFNGINYNINKDGELSIKFNSPIDQKGKQSNEKAAGTEIKIDKDGGLKISDNEGQSWSIDRTSKKSTWTNGAESIVIDKEAKSITMESSGKMDASAKVDISLSSDKKISVKAKSDVEVTADTNMKLESKSNMAMKSGGSWNVQVSGNAMVKAGGNMQLEGGNLAQLKGNVTLLGNGSLPVAIAGVSLAMGFNGGGPMVSTILTGSGTVLAGT
jgi:hypothetical protein